MGSVQNNAIRLRINDGLMIAVPPSLSSITTYVLLEQEAWFEKEIDFLRCFLKPGMTAIDVGANLGVYSLLSAHLVGSSGRVFAYEPGSDARALLEYSRELNALQNLTIMDAALSDSAREGNLASAVSSELRSLSSMDTGERVQVTSLDLEGATHGWSSPDFIKIDAEGEEERIIAGGARFFAEHSPLVMFEIKAGEGVNERLRAIFPAIGYRLFRQLGGAPILVPDDAQQPLDDYELNLFAAKPDRVRSMSQHGLLVDSVSDWMPDDAARQNALSNWQNQKFASLVNIPSGFASIADPDYRNSLAAYAVWRSHGYPVATRCAALAFALRNLREVCARAPTGEHLSTFARVASEWGARGESLAVLQRLFKTLQSAPLQIREPFWPASARFEVIVPGPGLDDWFVASAAEQFERTGNFSSLSSSSDPSPLITWLCSQPSASTEMERRRVLIAARAGQRPRVPARLCAAASDHQNADVWRAGRVPGTIVG